ncbi:MAG: hypothetical protein ACXVFT_14615, partial [Solirubrobacteraceae bacterium]
MTSRLLPLVLPLALCAAGCGAGSSASSTAGSAPAAGSHARTAAARTAAAARPVSLRVAAQRSLPAPVQLPGLAAVGSTVLAAGGLNAADTSVADVLRVAPGTARRAGSLPTATHDIGA